jgi:hypothetical protein
MDRMVILAALALVLASTFALAQPLPLPRPGRLVPTRLHHVRLVLHAVTGRAGSDREAAGRVVPVWLDIIGLVLPAQRIEPVTWGAAGGALALAN